MTRSLPEPINDVVAGGAGRYLLFHLRSLRKLAIFDVAQAKITRYLPLGSEDILYAAGSEKLVVVLRDQNVIQRYDLATLQKELTVSAPETEPADGLAMGHASAGPALLATRQGLRFLDLATLSLVDANTNSGVRSVRRATQSRSALQVRAAANGSTFAVWGPGLSPSGMRIVTLGSGAPQWRCERRNAGLHLPSYDGSLLFARAGIYSANLKPVSPEPFQGVACFPCYHPAYFLGFSGQNRSFNANSAGKAKLSLYTTSDKRLLVSFTEFDELNGPQESFVAGREPLTIDKRVHYFPTANLLVNVSAARDQLVLHRLDLTAALEKTGIDYLFVTSLPPASATPGSTLSYAIAVQSRRGGLRYTLDSGPQGMTLSDDGKLQWSVPAGQPAGRQGVIVTITDASGQEILHAFDIVTR